MPESAVLEQATTQQAAPTPAPDPMANIAAEFDARVAAKNPVAHTTQKEAEPTPTPTEKKAAAIPDAILKGESTEPVEKHPFDVDIPENTKKDVKLNWGTARKAYDEAKAESAQLKKEIEALKKTPFIDEATKKELELLRQQKAEADATIEKVAFERTPKMQRFDREQTDVLENLKKSIPEEFKPTIVDTAAAHQGVDRIKFLEDSGLSPLVQSTIANGLRQVDLLRASKAREMENYQTGLAEHRAQEEAQKQRENAIETEKQKRDFEAVHRELASTMGVLKEIPGNDAWNEKVHAIKEEASNIIFGEVKFHHFARAVIAGVAAEQQQQIISAQAERIKALETNVQRLTAGQPGAGDAHKDGQNNVPAANDMSGPAIEARFDAIAARRGS